jgi:hypothetical protein
MRSQGNGIRWKERFKNETVRGRVGQGKGGNLEGAVSTSCPISHEGKKKLHGLSQRANYTDRATAACR